MPIDPVHDAIYLKVEQAIEENYRGADGSYPVSPSAVATLATAAALAAITEQGKSIVDQADPGRAYEIDAAALADYRTAPYGDLRLDPHRAAAKVVAALAEHGLTVVDRSDQTGDLRHRYAAAILSDFYEPHEIKESAHYGGSVFAAVDRILAVRDEELEGLRSQLPQCNGLCLRASDVLDDMSRVVGNPVARAHRSCPLHGDLEAAARELDGALSRAETERDEWRERAEKAEAALAWLHTYATHRRGCAADGAGQACTCGLAALDTPEPR